MAQMFFMLFLYFLVRKKCERFHPARMEVVTLIRLSAEDAESVTRKLVPLR